ncbi:prepilin peptidase [Flavobacterium capsici]|uniref:prepilin peptidase n=1 Tax=Flavobacterium capsici TaxID=3075618 RepID=UPI00374FB644
MNYIILSAILLLLIAIVYQDLKQRKIHVVLPIMIFVFSLIVAKNKIDLSTKIILTNLFFLIIVISSLVVYMSLKNKKFLNPFANYFGLGDFLFYVAITPLFFTFNYLLFFIFSMLFSIIMQLVLRKVMAEKTVPLAGFSSILLIAIMVNDLFLPFQKMTII